MTAPAASSLSVGRYGLTVLVALLAALAGWLGARYASDIRLARERSSSGSAVARTACGPIEYAATGTGPVLLVVHGTGGGFDQGMQLGREFVHRGFRVIAMSRFGYLRTPVPEDPSPQAQADAHVCLLDALGVSRAAIIGASAGALSATQFAIRHPDRCSSLILLVPLAWHPGTVTKPPSFTMRFALAALRSDFAFWLLLELAPGVATRTLLATPPQLIEATEPAEQKRIATIRDSIMPVSTRAAGLRIDAANAASLSRHELDTIRAPTLVIALEDDLFDTYPGARFAAEQVRGAEFMSFPSGGHLWVGHHEDIVSRAADFAREALRDPG